MTHFFLTLSAGMFHSAVALLPQTFTLWALTLAISAWMVGGQ